MPKKTILLTGASGFIGKRYVAYNADRYNIRPVSLQRTSVREVDFKGVDTVLHLAGKAHQMQKIDPQIYFDVNYGLTKGLAVAAQQAGVPHFVFMSTIKVFGEHQQGVLTLNSPCLPINDPYGESKLKAEEFLKTIDDDNFVVSIIRPPLVYGPSVKGNLIRFLHLGKKNVPLPFGGINNRRTMVFLDNLIALCNKIVETRQPGIFLAGDRQPISTTKLISEIRKNLNKQENLFPMPGIFLNILKKIKPELVIRLFGSLEMDTSTTNKRLNFTPPYTIEEGMKAMVNWFKNTGEGKP